MSTVPSFNEELHRLIRAINDSLERESELQRELRRTKESLVSVALRLQVAIKVAQEDEYTIASLQQEVADARKEAIVSNKQATLAAEMTAQLNLEISALKRKLKSLEAEKIAAGPNPNVLSDAEVNSMMSNDLINISLLPNIGGDPNKATAFEKWKIQQFLYSPDTPAASESHDKHVVDMLTMAATSANHKKRDITRPTQTLIAKMNKPVVLPEMNKSKDTYQLDITRWGEIDNFEHENKARVNMWTSNSSNKNKNDNSGNNNNNVRVASPKILKSIRNPDSQIRSGSTSNIRVHAV